MNDTESIEAKKVVSRYEDRKNRHGGDSLENIMQTYFETILYMLHKAMLERPGEIIPMVVKGKEERDFFLMLLRKIDLPPDVCAVVATPSGREKIGPQMDKKEKVDLLNKESSMLIISHYQKRDRVFHVALPGLLSIGTDIYEDGNLICSYDYNTIDECLNELSKIVWKYLGPREALSKEQIIQYTENWFAKSDDIPLKGVPFHKEFNYIYHPELIGTTLPTAVLKAMAAALLKKNDLDKLIYDTNDLTRSAKLNFPIVTKEGIMKNVISECSTLIGMIDTELDGMFDVLQDLPDIELALNSLWKPIYNRTIFDKTAAEIYETLTGQPYPGNPTA